MQEDPYEQIPREPNPKTFEEIFSIDIDKLDINIRREFNDGKEDQHLPLHEDDWYWEIITDPRFEAAHKILEYRNTSISDIKSNIEMIENKFHGI